MKYKIIEGRKAEIVLSNEEIYEIDDLLQDVSEDYFEANKTIRELVNKFRLLANKI